MTSSVAKGRSTNRLADNALAGDEQQEGTSQSQKPSLIGRTLFGGVLALMALDGFENNNKRVEYAALKGVLLPRLLVPFSTGMLLVGSLGIIVWRVPTLATGAVASFFVGVTPQMHDFWNSSGEERQSQRTNFEKNIVILGAALAFLREATREK